MNATIHNLKTPSKATLSKFICPQCGVDACDCGVAPIERAKAAVAATPGKSNRAIAADTGISEPTIRRARNSTASYDAVSNDGTEPVEVPKRIGLDGKERKLPTAPERVVGVDFEELNNFQIAAVEREVRRAEKDANPELAKAIGKVLADGMRATMGFGGRDIQEISPRTAPAVADLMMGEYRRKTVHRKPMPPIDEFVTTIAMKLARIFPSPKLQIKLDALIEHRADIKPKERGILIDTLRALANRIIDTADKLEA